MSYCLNPQCPKPQNTNAGNFCLTCGSKLLLKERYRAIKPIGQGGFGRTFVAVDEDKPSKPRCVIKQFYPQAQGTSTVQKAVELFNQEAMRLDELGKHPQIPELLAYFTQDDRQYLVQEFIDGQNLAQELADGGVYNEVRIRQLLDDLLPVLQFCHAQQVIHRDIKPENIIRRGSDRKPVVVDFGASKVVTHTALNRTGTSIGSPEYVAPEQIRGQAIFASDIYSLGATCLKLLTGRSPFDLYDINHDTWIWREYLANPISKDLGDIFDRMLESIPARRYQTVAEILQILNQPSSSSVISPPIKTNFVVPQSTMAATQISAPPTSVANNTEVSPPNPVNLNPTNNPTNSRIDQELDEIKTMFTGINKPGSKTSNSPTSSTPSPKSKIDDELEELRAKYSNNES
ncbi:serine/threonine-protein kinase [Calothrix sp. 336/3]|uniref:serine/threonine-protein kinase n=1 Tax=Calothrix sp. 336/3 TaxID=1337936 RepID=UPI0004E3C907|nr:serine/threonine-protein kinase [Calothrix sp. 336/3]AKG22737.1 serine/threonine protein kinase [Calothrix sp. 336/3]